MDIYGKSNQIPIYKKCKEGIVRSIDGKLEVFINYEFLPDLHRFFVGINLSSTSCGTLWMFVENDGMGESLTSFKKRMARWIKDHSQQLNLSWYAAKRLMMIACDAYKIKRRR